jgi:hypothetical protein
MSLNSSCSQSRYITELGGMNLFKAIVYKHLAVYESLMSSKEGAGTVHFLKGALWLWLNQPCPLFMLNPFLFPI